MSDNEPNDVPNPFESEGRESPSHFVTELPAEAMQLLAPILAKFRELHPVLIGVPNETIQTCLGGLYPSKPYLNPASSTPDLIVNLGMLHQHRTTEKVDSSTISSICGSLIINRPPATVRINPDPENKAGIEIVYYNNTVNYVADYVHHGSEVFILKQSPSGEIQLTTNIPTYSEELFIRDFNETVIPILTQAVDYLTRTRDQKRHSISEQKESAKLNDKDAETQARLILSLTTALNTIHKTLSESRSLNGVDPGQEDQKPNILYLSPNLPRVFPFLKNPNFWLTVDEYTEFIKTLKSLEQVLKDLLKNKFKMGKKLSDFIELLMGKIKEDMAKAGYHDFRADFWKKNETALTGFAGIRRRALFAAGLLPEEERALGYIPLLSERKFNARKGKLATHVENIEQLLSRTTDPAMADHNFSSHYLDKLFEVMEFSIDELLRGDLFKEVSPP